METKISTSALDLYYGTNHALKNINLDIYKNKITAFIGPSGCGKSTYLKTLNRMNDLVPGVKITGNVLLDGEDIYDPAVDTTLLRKKVGMVFQDNHYQSLTEHAHEHHHDDDCGCGHDHHEHHHHDHDCGCGHDHHEHHHHDHDCGCGHDHHHDHH